MRTYVVLLLSFVLGCLACSSVAARISDEMDHRRWTASDRGPSAVGALAQTADGYLWLGTHDSLYRFDGFEFEKFASAEGESLGVVSALASTADGLWVGFRAGGVRLITPGGVMHPADSGLPEGVVYSLAEDQQGQMWVAADEGLARHDGAAWSQVGNEAGFAGRHARAVHVDADGYLWAASEDEIFMLPPGAPAFMPTGIKSHSISHIASSPSGEVWIADRSRERLLRLIKTSYATIEWDEMSTASASSIIVDEQGGAWLGTQGAGVQYVAAGKGQPKSPADAAPSGAFTALDGLSSDGVLALHIDHDGTLWVGTDAGLDRLKRKTLAPLALPGGAGSQALAVDKDGSLWVASDNGRIMRVSGDSRSTFEMDMPVSSLVASDRYGVLAGGRQGIFSLSDSALVRIASLPVESSPESAVRAMTVDRNGDIWVSVNRAGLFVWADQRWRRIEPVSSSERQIMPVSASRDLDGKLWFGYRDNLVVSFDEQKIERWSDSEGLNIGNVTAMLHLPDRTWLGGQHGLAYFSDGRFHRLDLPAAESFQNIYGLVAVQAEDNAQESGMDLWIHSRSGIFRLPAAEIGRVIAGGDTLLYSSHDQIGRLPVDPLKVLPLPTAVHSPGGYLWFASGRGVVQVDPHEPRESTQPSAVMIKGLTADGADLDLAAETVRLSAAPQNLVIDYSALNLSSPDTMRFQYRLDGHDGEWIDAGRSRQAVYSRLRPGEYEFQVRALDANGLLNLPEAALPIVIPQVFYLRPWFVLICTAALAILVLWLSHVYLQREKAALRTRLEERFQERERIARELHDTLLQSIQGMMLSLQAVADTLPAISHARRSMERALDRAEQVIAEGRDRITGLRGQMAPSEDLAVAFQALPLDAGPPFSAVYSVSNRGEPVPLRNEVRDAFYQVGREAVFNALRHAQASRIAVSFTYATDTFEMSVIDDGIGIEPLYLRMHGRPEHGGLRGMYERAERIEATLAIISNARSGTRLSLSLPGTVAYEQTVDGIPHRSSKAG